jgi:hypothetical protein
MHRGPKDIPTSPQHTAPTALSLDSTSSTCHGRPHELLRSFLLGSSILCVAPPDPRCASLIVRWSVVQIDAPCPIGPSSLCRVRRSCLNGFTSLLSRSSSTGRLCLPVGLLSKLNIPISVQYRRPASSTVPTYAPLAFLCSLDDQHRLANKLNPSRFKESQPRYHKI